MGEVTCRPLDKKGFRSKEQSAVPTTKEKAKKRRTESCHRSDTMGVISDLSRSSFTGVGRTKVNSSMLMNKSYGSG